MSTHGIRLHSLHAVVRRRFLLSVVLAIIAGLVGCSDKDSASSGSTSPPIVESTTVTTYPLSTPPTSVGVPGVDITGRWVVTEFTTDGEWHAVEFGRDAEGEPVANANAHRQPWIEIGAEEMQGPLGGCNDFFASYSFTGGVLRFKDSFRNLMGCQPSDLEDAVLSLFAPTEVVRVEIEDESMTWSTSEFSMRFTRQD